jgi:hypothetical protein
LETYGDFGNLFGFWKVRVLSSFLTIYILWICLVDFKQINYALQPTSLVTNLYYYIAINRFFPQLTVYGFFFLPLHPQNGIGLLILFEWLKISELANVTLVIILLERFSAN